MGHNVGKAAENAVNKSVKTSDSKETPEQILAGIRNNLASGLYVTPDKQRFLLSQYDVTKELYDAAVRVITARNHEIEKVKEAIA